MIVAASLLVGLGVNAFRADLAPSGQPRRLPLVTPPKADLAAGEIVAMTEAEQLWNEGVAFFLDSRTSADYQAGHIAHAHSLPDEDFASRYGDVEPLLTRDAEIIVYCDGVECDLSHRLLEKLRALGYPRVRVLVNGWSEWRKAGLPTATGAQP